MQGVWEEYQALPDTPLCDLTHECIYTCRTFQKQSLMGRAQCTHAETSRSFYIPHHEYPMPNTPLYTHTHTHLYTTHPHTHTCRASMNCRVPDLAMVPRLLTRSALVIPTPESMMVSVLSSLLGIMVIFISFSDSSTDGSVRLWYLTLSRAYRGAHTCIIYDVQHTMYSHVHVYCSIHLNTCMVHLQRNAFACTLHVD